MTTSNLVEELSGAPSRHGLLEDIRSLHEGRTRLDLEGFRFDPIRNLPLYVFNLIDDDGALVGQYHFAPGAPEAVGEIGNAGGYVEAAYRNRGHSKEAIKALGELASRHGMDSFIITCPKDNDAARKALDQVGTNMANRDGDICFYEIPASKSN
jgi:RimJ/RimL family protein N-acetyltransferase